MSSPSNPLLGWAGQSGVNGVGGQLPSPLPQPSPVDTSSGALNPNQWYQSNASNLKDINRYQAGANLNTSLLRNTLAPEFANEMFGLAQPAGNFFNTLMNLGSPYYQQQQRASWEQGVGQGNDAAAQARQQLKAQGYGATPSGANAAMMGGMATGMSGNLAMTFLQNLFNNSQMQVAGAQGLSQLASLFNPSSMIGQPGASATSTPGSQIFQNVLQGIGALFGQGGVQSIGTGH